MTGPKHLWSGNWEEESGSQPAPSEPYAAPRDPEPSAAPAPERPKRRRAAWIAAGTLAAVAIAVAVVLSTQGGSSPRRTPLTPAAPTPSLAATTPTTLTTPPVSPRPISWLGMEIVTLPSGAQTVETVRAGSQGDQAGLSPGDVILQINNRPVTGAGGIATAIHGLHAGDRVVMQISHGSSLHQTEATLGAPPTPYP